MSSLSASTSNLQRPTPPPPAAPPAAANSANQLVPIQNNRGNQGKEDRWLTILFEFFTYNEQFVCARVNKKWRQASKDADLSRREITALIENMSPRDLGLRAKRKLTNSSPSVLFTQCHPLGVMACGVPLIRGRDRRFADKPVKLFDHVDSAFLGFQNYFAFFQSSIEGANKGFVNILTVAKTNRNVVYNIPVKEALGKELTAADTEFTACVPFAKDKALAITNGGAVIRFPLSTVPAGAANKLVHRFIFRIDGAVKLAYDVNKKPAAVGKVLLVPGDTTKLYHIENRNKLHSDNDNWSTNGTYGFRITKIEGGKEELRAYSATDLEQGNLNKPLWTLPLETINTQFACMNHQWLALKAEVAATSSSPPKQAFTVIQSHTGKWRHRFSLPEKEKKVGKAFLCEDWVIASHGNELHFKNLRSRVMFTKALPETTLKINDVMLLRRELLIYYTTHSLKDGSRYRVDQYWLPKSAQPVARKVQATVAALPAPIPKPKPKAEKQVAAAASPKPLPASPIPNKFPAPREVQSSAWKRVSASADVTLRTDFQVKRGSLPSPIPPVPSPTRSSFPPAPPPDAQRAVPYYHEKLPPVSGRTSLAKASIVPLAEPTPTPETPKVDPTRVVAPPAAESSGFAWLLEKIASALSELWDLIRACCGSRAEK